MKETCLKCHTKPRVDEYYRGAEAQIAATNAIVREAKTIMESMRAAGKLSPKPFDEPLDYLYFDMWHYAGRTSKHGAFMGGADFVQWHGNYELVTKLTEIRRQAIEAGVRVPDSSPVAPVVAGH